MTAYEVLADRGNRVIDEGAFYCLVREFRAAFLTEEAYAEKLERHRSPIELKNVLLQKLYIRAKAINERPEMRCQDLDREGLNFVTSVLQELWRRDKRVRSLFQLVEIFCQLQPANQKEIAIHVAEYRAIYQLIHRFRREIMLSERAMSRKYTFEDWLGSKLWREKTYNDEYVTNDSEKFLDLVAMDKLTYEDLNKIQDAQQKAYDYLIESSLQLNLQHFRRQTKDTLGIEQVTTAKLQEINQYFQEHQAICREVMLPKKHRGIKWGPNSCCPSTTMHGKTKPCWMSTTSRFPDIW